MVSLDIVLWLLWAQAGCFGLQGCDIVKLNGWVPMCCLRKLVPNTEIQDGISWDTHRCESLMSSQRVLSWETARHLWYRYVLLVGVFSISNIQAGRVSSYFGGISDSGASCAKLMSWLLQCSCGHWSVTVVTAVLVTTAVPYSYGGACDHWSVAVITAVLVTTAVPYSYGGACNHWSVAVVTAVLVTTEVPYSYGGVCDHCSAL
jgi:hypothetical protein